MNILFLDIESTGLNPKQHSVIQIAAEYHENGKVVKKFNKHLTPKNTYRKVNLGALKVNGVKYGNLSSLGEADSVVRDFVDFLLEISTKENLIVCGHNVAFDIKFLSELLEDHDIENLEALIGYKNVDTYGLAIGMKHANIINLEKFNLESLAKYFEIKIEGEELLNSLQNKFHDAAYDVKVTAAVYYAMLDKFKKFQ